MRKDVCVSVSACVCLFVGVCLFPSLSPSLSLSLPLSPPPLSLSVSACACEQSARDALEQLPQCIQPTHVCDNAGAVNLQLGLVVLKVQVDNNDVVFALSVDIGKRCGPPKCVQKIKKIKKKSKARNKERKERHIRCAKKKKT